jgi:PST family polysaccharide transporter
VEDESREGAGGGAGQKRSLAERTMSAAQFRVAGSLAQGVLQLGVGILLARLLPPEDFGVVGMAMVVIGLALLMSDLGLGPAVVQRRDLSERHLRVAFSAAILTGAALAAFLAALAPFSVLLLDDAPELPGVIRALSLVFVFGAVGVTPRALLQRELRAATSMGINLASYVVGYALVVGTLALHGHGVWALVWGSLVQAALGSGLALALVRPPVRPLLARAEMRDLFGFGAQATLNSVVGYAAHNSDNLIVGRWLGAAALGVYGRAYNLMVLPLTHVLGAATQAVLYPAMAHIQTDPGRLRRAYLLSVQIAALAAAPIMAGMMVAAPHMVVTLYGTQWAGAATPLQILCGAGILRSIYFMASSVTFATGHIGAELKRQLVYTALVVGGGIGGTRWGVAGVAAGVCVAVTFMYLSSASLALRIVGGGWREFVEAQLPGAALGALVGVAALSVRLTLEEAGVGSGGVFAGIVAGCALALPAGLYLLPHRVRPDALFQRLGSRVARLPRPLQQVVGRVLHLHVPRPA